MCHRGSLPTGALQSCLALWLLVDAGTGTKLGSVSAAGSASLLLQYWWLAACACKLGAPLLGAKSWLLASMWGEKSVSLNACTLVQRTACCNRTGL